MEEKEVQEEKEEVKQEEEEGRVRKRGKKMRKSTAFPRCLGKAGLPNTLS